MNQPKNSLELSAIEVIADLGHYFIYLIGHCKGLKDDKKVREDLFNKAVDSLTRFGEGIVDGGEKARITQKMEQAAKAMAADREESEQANPRGVSK